MKHPFIECVCSVWSDQHARHKVRDMQSFPRAFRLCPCFQADSAQVLNIPATPNSLSLVLSNGRDLRFVKYLSSSAPSHRIDTAGVFRLRVTGSEEVDE